MEVEYMNRLNLKGKILVVLFIIFLIISAIMFNFEKMVLAIISFIIAFIFALLLAIYHKKNLK